jgi:hypothetical protein
LIGAGARADAPIFKDFSAAKRREKHKKERDPSNGALMLLQPGFRRRNHEMKAATKNEE